METTQPGNDCDPEVYANGEVVFLIAGLPSTAVEALIVRVREETSVRVDWHFVGGRAFIRVLGDDEAKERVRKELRRMMPVFQEVF
jgi:hypothetical protein